MLLIDPPAWPAHGRLWSHLVSTTSYAELHDFADRAGISRRAFEGDHYDIPQERYDEVVAAGATPTEGRDLLIALRDSGLRISKRKHERVVLSTPDAPWLPPGSRADVIASRQDNPPPNTVVVRAALSSDKGLFVVERDDGGGPDLPTRTVQSGESAESALTALCEGIGVSSAGAALLGYVRNVVKAPGPGYAWPVPNACFTVFSVPSNGQAPTSGSWCPPSAQQRELGERHWWPLLSPEVQRTSGHVHP